MTSIAIDGPSGAGKSTMAKRLARDLNFVYVDTGAMYRTIALFVLWSGKDPASIEDVTALLPKIRMELKSIIGVQHMLLNGRDVSEDIRAESVGMAASVVSAYPAVREALLDRQRAMAQTQNIIMDGRDIGTVVLPDASLKIFLTATPESRAERRFKELDEKGVKANYDEVLADIRQRDHQDTHRAIAPLKQAEDAVLLDTSALDLEESYAALKRIAREHLYSGKSAE